MGHGLDPPLRKFVARNSCKLHGCPKSIQPHNLVSAHNLHS